MINPMAVAFDIDGVVADTMGLFLKIAWEEYQIKLEYEDITTYAWEDSLDISLEIIGAIGLKLIEGEHPPLYSFEGAAEVLTRLSRHNKKLLFVTARPHCGKMIEWFQELLPLKVEQIEIIAAGSFDAKTDILLEKQMRYFVEDRLETCFQLYDAGITPILFKQPWNRQEHPFTEVGNWSEIEALIDFNKD